MIAYLIKTWNSTLAFIATFEQSFHDNSQKFPAFWCWRKNRIHFSHFWSKRSLSFLSHSMPNSENSFNLLLYYWTGKRTGRAFKIVQRVPPFSYSIFIVRYKTGRDYRVPPSSFSRHCATFFSNFFLSPKGPPVKFFDYLQQSEAWKSPKGLPFQVFRHSETGSKFLFFEKIFNVSKGSPLQFFKHFAT